MKSIKSRIYLLKDKTIKDGLNIIWVGTTKNGNSRFSQHKHHALYSIEKENRNLSKYIRNIGWDNVQHDVLVEYEHYEDDDIGILDIESMYIKKFYDEGHPLQNYQHIKSKKQLKKESNERYYNKHKEKITIKRSSKIKCDLCSSEISSSHLARHKKHNCSKNPDRTETPKITIKCEICGLQLSKNSLSRHKKRWH